MKTVPVLVLGMAAWLTACSSQPVASKAPQIEQTCYGESTSQAGVQLDLIRQLVTQGQYYSALAHLEQNQLASPAAELLKAESLRKTGRLEQAMDVYQSLTKTCISAFGHLGIGKILAVRGNLDKARAELLLARSQAPTDANIRNDYGFLLLISGQLKEAQQEFMTAVQLNNQHQVAIKNLMLSFLLNGQHKTAWQIAQHHQIDMAEFKSLIKRSQHFRERVAGASEMDASMSTPVLDRTGAPL